MSRAYDRDRCAVGRLGGQRLNYGLLVRREQPSLAGSPFLLTMNPPDGPFLDIPHPSMIVGQDVG